MAPVVVLVLALLVPSLSLPVTTPENAQIPQETPLTHTVTQTQSGFEEKTGVPVTGCLSGFSAPGNQENIVRVQNAPVNFAQAPSSQAETLFLPPQPVPVTQVDQTVRPVIVPAEAIASGRVIVMAIDPIQQRAFPDVIIAPQQPIITDTIIQGLEKQTPYQESVSPVQPSSYTEQQQIQTPQRQSQVQPETAQPAIEKQFEQSVVQAQPLQQQVVQQSEFVVKQTGEPVPKVQAAELTQQQNVQPTVEKQENVQVEPHQEVYTGSENVQKQADCATGQKQSEPQQRVDPQQQVQQQVDSQQQVQQPEVEVAQQQIYNVQPVQVVQQVQSVEPQQPVQEVQRPVVKTGVQEVDNVPQQVSTYTSGQTYNFGDKIPQQQVHQQQYLGQPVVVGNQ